MFRVLVDDRCPTSEFDLRCLGNSETCQAFSSLQCVLTSPVYTTSGSFAVRQKQCEKKMKLRGLTSWLHPTPTPAFPVSFQIMCGNCHPVLFNPTLNQASLPGDTRIGGCSGTVSCFASTCPKTSTPSMSMCICVFAMTEGHRQAEDTACTKCIINNLVFFSDI